MASPDRHFKDAAIFTHSTGITPNSGDAALYIKSDNKAYIKDSSGTEAAVVTSGSVDNAILRADGTGGSTSQSSDIVIDDATTSTQANVALLNNHSETNSSIVITPKGTGAFILGPKPDGTTTGGSARGVRAIDLQLSRASNASRASGQDSVCIGYNNTASNVGSIAIGDSNSATGSRSTCWGRDNLSSNSQCFSIGRYAVANRFGQLAFAVDRHASTNGSAQQTFYVLNGKTTTNAAVALTTPAGQFTIASGTVVSMLINIMGVKSDGSAVAHYVRQYCLKNVAGTTSEVYAPVTIGTDNAASTSISITADDTSDVLKVECTGIASEIWRWTASIYATETTYGT